MIARTNLSYGVLAATWPRIQLRKATEPSTPRNLRFTCKQIGPLVGPVVDKLGVADQAIDQCIALDPALACVGQELANVFGRWGQTGQIDINAGGENRRRCKARRAGSSSASTWRRPTRRSCRRSGARSRQSRSDHPSRSPWSRHSSLEPCQNRCLTASHRRDQAGLAGDGDLGVGDYRGMPRGSRRAPRRWRKSPARGAAASTRFAERPGRSGRPRSWSLAALSGRVSRRSAIHERMIS